MKASPVLFAQWPLGILITAVKSVRMGPLTDLYWEDRQERLLWVITASGKNTETSYLFKKCCCCHSHVRDLQCYADKMNDSKLGETRTNKGAGKHSSVTTAGTVSVIGLAQCCT